MILFATVKEQPNLDTHANFRGFGAALLTLFRMSTGESWHLLMYDCARPRSIIFDCEESPTYEQMLPLVDGMLSNPKGCGSRGTSYLYFMSFMIIVSFVFLNLFIAIILESFNSS